ncbi:MAG: HAD family hydrolase [Propionibacteriaceae bacterium]|nr:MAG: HAD family hydrolase [Propionibacteriaceae bacterium]
MSANESPGVLLDVDGTLLDTNYLHALAWWQAFRDAGVAGVTMADTHRAVGIASDGLVERLAQEADARTKAKVVKRHSKRYAKLQDEVVAFSGADHLVRRCREAGFRVVLATSGPKSDLDWMLPAIGLEDGVLAGATTSDDVSEGKPAPDLMTTAMQQHGLDPAHTVAIGDTVWDVQAAQRAGVRIISLTCGGISGCELSGAGADEVFDGPADLVDRWDDSLLAKLV